MIDLHVWMHCILPNGHHRSAAAALVGAEMDTKKIHIIQGMKNIIYFMAVCFPASQLTVIDYNRLVNHLNGYSPEQFLELLQPHFDVYPQGTDIYHPEALHSFGLYLGGQWYKLVAKPHTYAENNPIDRLDVTHIKQIYFTRYTQYQRFTHRQKYCFCWRDSWIRDTCQSCRQWRNAVSALALYPVSMQQLMDIADLGEIMPPTTTWFEPKLRSGLVIHKLNEE